MTGLYISMFSTACSFDKVEPVEQADFCDTLTVSYNLQIKDIVTTNCAYVGCHIGGFPSGDFTTYEGMLSRLENGEIERRTVNLLDMPPLPDTLSANDLEIFSCWISKGYPEQ